MLCADGLKEGAATPLSRASRKVFGCRPAITHLRSRPISAAGSWSRQQTEARQRDRRQRAAPDAGEPGRLNPYSAHMAWAGVRFDQAGTLRGDGTFEPLGPPMNPIKLRPDASASRSESRWPARRSLDGPTRPLEGRWEAQPGCPRQSDSEQFFEHVNLNGACAD
jgi:hypothetical protein